MASRLELDISCPVCLELFKDPVVLSCSHSFCKACVQNWWTEKVTRECPVCKRRSSKSDPPCNLVLKNLCEVFSQELTVRDHCVQPEPLCPQHKEKLQLFCQDHQQPVCLVCRDSRAHHRHRFSPIDEAVQEYRELLTDKLRPLQDTLEKCRDVKDHWDRTSEHIKQQGQHTERMIQTEFDKIRVFLQKEEQARIRALRTEVQQKISLMEKRVATLSGEISALSESIKQTEEELKAQDVPFLQNYTAAVGRVQHVPLKSVPELPSGSLVDVATHLGNLSFNIWSKMKELVSYTPVVLDPNTASPLITVSEDLCSVKYRSTKNEMLPDNPERFKEYMTVLGSKAFTPGSHSWEIEVQNDANWAVGVLAESVSRKGDIDTGYWEIWFIDGKFKAYAPPVVDEVLMLKYRINRIRVDLHWDRGILSFSDSQTRTHIYTFTSIFKTKLFPFINTVNPKIIQILPRNVSVQL